MAELTAIRQALADALQDNIADLQASPYPLSSPEPPAAHVVPDEQLFHQAFGDGMEQWSFRVQVFLAFVDDIGAQRKADQFLDDGLVRLALEADPTLGGLVADLIVDRALFRLWEPAGVPMVGAEWFLRILI